MMNVLVLLSRYVPGYKSGGPLRSVERIVSQLGEEIAFSILTTDRDGGDLSAYRDVDIDSWIKAGQAEVHYTSPRGCSFAGLSQIIRQRRHDALYLNSFFSPRFSVAPMVARGIGRIPRKPVIIAPRGEFSPGALAMKAPKKLAFLKVAHTTGFWRDVTWQASNDGEADDILNIMRCTPDRIHIASDLSPPVTATLPAYAPRAAQAPLRVLFLSRLTPKKNLGFALDVLSGVRCPVALSVVGPEEDSKYVAYCRQQAARLPGNVTVSWQGAVRNEDLHEVFGCQDLFFLPTRGENFGHVIAEAISAGVPLLLSDTTPWRNLNALGVGHDLPLSDLAAFRAVIEAQAALTSREHLAQRSAVHAYAKLRAAKSIDLAANRALFLSLRKDTLGASENVARSDTSPV